MKKLLRDKRITFGFVALVVVALVAALFAPIETELKVEIVSVLTILGTTVGAAMRGAAYLLPVAFVLVVSAVSGCTASDQSAARATLRPVVKVTCAIARRIVQACPYAEGAVGATETTGDEVLEVPDEPVD